MFLLLSSLILILFTNDIRIFIVITCLNLFVLMKIMKIMNELYVEVIRFNSLINN